MFTMAPSRVSQSEIINFYQTITERHKSFRIHTQRSACLTRYGGFKISSLKGKYAIYNNAVYNQILQQRQDHLIDIQIEALRGGHLR